MTLTHKRRKKVCITYDKCGIWISKKMYLRSHPWHFLISCSTQVLLISWSPSSKPLYLYWASHELEPKIEKASRNHWPSFRNCCQPGICWYGNEPLEVPNIFLEISFSYLRRYFQHYWWILCDAGSQWSSLFQEFMDCCLLNVDVGVGRKGYVDICNYS